MTLDKEHFQYLGTIQKIHGNQGFLLLSSTPPFSDSVELFDILFFEINGGLVPFFIEDTRSFGTDQFLIRTEDIDTPEKAKKYIKCRVFIPRDQQPELPENQLYAELITGYKLVDLTTGSEGIITDVILGEEQDLLVTEMNNQEVLIPAVEAFIREINHAQKMITLLIPDGLIDLNK